MVLAENTGAIARQSPRFPRLEETAPGGASASSPCRGLLL
jgi:hypothetical protein